MNFIHLMKKVAIAALCVLSTANAQDKRFAFKGSAASSGGGITVVTAREKTGWTSNGTTTAQDTLATIYRLDKANIRFIVTDTDGDTLWFYPQNLHPFVLKDGTSLLSGIDSTGRGYFGGNAATTGQTRRALLNVVGTGDTVVAFIGDGNRAPGDSSVLIHASASLQSAGRAGFGVNTSGQGSRAILNAASRAGGDSLLVLTAESNYGVGDSSAVFDQVGRLSIGGAQGSNLRKLAVVSGSNKASLDPTDILFGTTTTDYSERITRSGNSFDFYTNTVARFRLGSNGYVAVGNNFATSDAAIQAFFTVRANGTADTLMMARNDKNSTLDSTAMVFADGSIQFGTASGGADAFTTTAETDTVTVVGAGVNDIYTITLKGTAAPAAADLCAVEALAGKFVVHRSAAGTSALAYYWRRERR